MTVIFEAKAENRYSIHNLKGTDDEGNIINFGQQVFKKGVKMTSDKDLIRALLQHEGYSRGDFELITNKDVVADYLEGVEPDKITKEILDNISIEGVRKLGKLLSARNEQPALIKIEIVGSPITSRVQELLNFYETKYNKPQEPQSEIEQFESKHSKDMTVREALQYIKDTPNDQLNNYISEGEDRKTILEAYKKEVGTD